MRIVLISDTHNRHGQIAVPDGDILVHSGDATFNGTPAEIEAFGRWFTGLPHRHKVFVAGNHDWLFQTDNAAARSLLGEDIVYLQDSSAEIGKIKFYGSPWQPRFYDWAFNLERGRQMAEKWSLIPDDTEVLITHGPPKKILDAVVSGTGESHEGCEELRRRVEEIASAGRLKLHAFGHIHSGHGIHREWGVTFINSSICDESYRPTQPPIVFDI